MTGFLLPCGSPAPTARRVLIAAVPPDVERATDEALELRDAQLERVSQGVLSRLGRLGQSILGQVAEALGGSFTARLRSLTDALGGLTEAWAREVTTVVQMAQSDAVAIGQELVDSRLITAGVDILAPDVSLELMQVLKDFSADKIKGLSADLLNRVNQQLRLGAMGQISVEDMIRGVADIVPPLREGDADETARQKAIESRAETIVITEVGRVHSMASWARLQQALIARPDLMKEWRHSGLQLNPRSGHQAINGVRVPANTPFRVAPIVGGASEPMQYPHDPSASARNTVRCKCVVLAYLPEWGDL